MMIPRLEALEDRLVLSAFHPEGALLADFSRFLSVLAVAHATGQIQQASTANDAASSHVYKVAFVVPGFSYTAWEPPPTWARSLDTALYQAGYDRVVNFMWNSGTLLNPISWSPLFLHLAEVRLAWEVQQVARSFPPNSVVDVNLIGHSRGVEVIAGASSLLASTSVPQLQNGSLELTLLDPHPDSNAYSPNESIKPSPLGNLAGSVYHLIQQVMNDPPLSIPANVDYVSEYYQHTLWSQIPFLSEEQILNLWGLTPAQIAYNPADTVFTSEELPPPIGHSEVHDWYTQNIVPQLANGPA
jgi:hypothetical protein